MTFNVSLQAADVIYNKYIIKMNKHSSSFPFSNGILKQD